MTSHLCSLHHFSFLPPYPWLRVNYPRGTQFHWRLRRKHRRGSCTRNSLQKSPAQDPKCHSTANTLEHQNQDSGTGIDKWTFCPEISSQWLWKTLMAGSVICWDQTGERSQELESSIHLRCLKPVKHRPLQGSWQETMVWQETWTINEIMLKTE